jgi:hypothetical protein
MYKCGWNGCEKAYGTLNHLNAHVTMQSHGSKRTPEGTFSNARCFFFFFFFSPVGRHLVAWSHPLKMASAAFASLALLHNTGARTCGDRSSAGDGAELKYVSGYPDAHVTSAL